VAVEVSTEELLRISLARLSREVVKTYPQFGEMLTQHMARTRSLAPDPERARHYQELGVLLMDLGRLYLAESDAVMEGVREIGAAEAMEPETMITNTDVHHHEALYCAGQEAPKTRELDGA
jgi:hypothetical protein